MAHDLHTHTNRSDGENAPGDLVMYAATRGVDVLAITDHDTMAGVPAADPAGKVSGVRVIPGIELSIRVPHGSMHLLGYFSDLAPQPLTGLLAGFAETREERAREMVDRLNDLGVPVGWDEVRDGAAGAALGRPHIADALVRAGHVPDRRAAFDLYLGDGRPAYVASHGLEVDEGITLVRESGGAAVLAHPGTLGLDRAHLDPFVGRLARAGLAGIEVHRPEHSPDQFAAYATLAQRYGLVPSGGSDYHRSTSPYHPGDTGDPPLPGHTIDRLMAAALG